MNPKIFFEYAQRTGAFRCIGDVPCGTNTTVVGVECPRGTACQWREAFEAGWEARRALGDPPEIEFVIDCRLCNNTGWLESEKWGRVPCGMCGRSFQQQSSQGPSE